MMLLNFNDKFRDNLASQWAEKYQLTPKYVLDMISEMEHIGYSLSKPLSREFIQNYIATNAVRFHV